MAESTVYEEVPLAEMDWNAAEHMYTYLCPCGDLFEITLEDLLDGEDIAPCPSCTLKIRVLYDIDALQSVSDSHLQGSAGASEGITVA